MQMQFGDIVAKDVVGDVFDIVKLKPALDRNIEGELNFWYYSCCNSS